MKAYRKPSSQEHKERGQRTHRVINKFDNIDDRMRNKKKNYFIKNINRKVKKSVRQATRKLIEIDITEL